MKSINVARVELAITKATEAIQSLQNAFEDETPEAMEGQPSIATREQGCIFRATMSIEAALAYLRPLAERSASDALVQAPTSSWKGV